MYSGLEYIFPLLFCSEAFFNKLRTESSRHGLRLRVPDAPGSNKGQNIVTDASRVSSVPSGGSLDITSN